MHLRTLSLSFVLLLLGFTACLAQQPTGPATLENLLLPDKAQKPAAALKGDAADVGPKQFVGTVVRPQDGVQHPDLDKGWAVYDASAAKAAESIKAAISKQFDAATAKGGLDAAEKWQATLEKFEKTGELPTEKEAKTAVSAATTVFNKAGEELTKAYETVVSSLTMEQKIAEARAVRAEGVAVSGGQASEDADKRERKPDDDVEKRMLTLFIGEWRHENGNVEEIAPGGVYFINGNPLDSWGGRWKFDSSDPRGPCLVRHANNGTLTRWYIGPGKPTVLVAEKNGKNGKMTRIGSRRDKPR